MPIDRYLVIDDDSAFCAVLQRGLRRYDLQAEVAHGYVQALEVAARYQPTHAIVDLKLGEDSGLHLIEPLLNLNQDMKIIVLTGYGSIATAVKAIKAGARNYLAKPVDVQTVLAALDSTGALDSVVPPDKPIALRNLEWEHIQRVLEEYDGNISATARCLGMHRRTLQRKLKKRPSQS